MRTFAPMIINDKDKFIDQQNTECYRLYMLLDKNRETKIWDYIQDFWSFFRISAQMPSFPDETRANFERELSRYVFTIHSIINQEIGKIYQRNPHLSYYSSSEDFKFSKLRVVPEVLIVKDCFPLRKLFLFSIKSMVIVDLIQEKP